MAKPVPGEIRFFACTKPNAAGEIASWYIYDDKRGWVLCDGADGRPKLSGIAGTQEDATRLLHTGKYPPGASWPKPDRIMSWAQ